VQRNAGQLAFCPASVAYSLILPCSKLPSVSFSHHHPLETENSLGNIKVKVCVLSSHSHWHARSVPSFLCFVMCILIFFLLEAFNLDLIWMIHFWKAE